MNHKTAIISGISGFIGTNLKPYLRKKEYEVIGVSRREAKNDKTVSYEELNVDAMNLSKVFIHLAGKAHDLKKTSSNEEYYKVNTELTKLLFDMWLNSSSKIFIFISTVKAVTDKVEDELTEKCNPTPITVYGKSKLQAENYILSKRIPEGKYVYILRPCMIHGPNNKGNLNLLYNVIRKGIPYPLGAFKNKRSFLSIDNLCFVIEKLINIKPQSGIYNVADDEAISTRDLVAIIGETLNRKIRIIKIPKPIVKFLAKIGDILFLPLNSERLEKLTENFVVSNTKIKKAISVEFLLETREGIKKTINSFK